MITRSAPWTGNPRCYRNRLNLEQRGAGGRNNSSVTQRLTPVAHCSTLKRIPSLHSCSLMRCCHAFRPALLEETATAYITPRVNPLDLPF